MLQLGYDWLKYIIVFHIGIYAAYIIYALIYVHRVLQ